MADPVRGLGVGRAALGLFAAAFAGGFALSTLLVLTAFLPGPNGGTGALLIAMLALPIWFVATLLVGGPVWAVFHSSGQRDRRTAVTAGSGLAAVAVPLFIWVMILAASPQGSNPSAAIVLIVLALMGGMSGAIAGNALWLVAYSRID